MPPQCCRCNGQGRCRSCKCVRDGVNCTNCTPGRNGRCENTAPPVPPPVPPPSAPRHPDPSCAVDAMDAMDQEQAPSATATVEQSSEAGVAALLPSNLTPGVESNLLGPNPTTPTTPNSIRLQPLPSPSPMADPTFVWGPCDAETFTHSLTAAYTEVVHWKRNLFRVPYGNSGKKFVQELSRLFRAYADQSALESVALQAITVMSILLLQRPARNCKAKDLASCLERRLNQGRI